MSAKIKTALEPIFVDIDTLAAITGISKTTIQGLIRNDEFPKPRAASKQRSVWLLREIKEWAETRPVANFLPPPNTSEGGRNSRKNIHNIG